MNTPKPDDLVKYTHPEKGEERLRFKVLEVNGDRLNMVCMNSGMAFPPVETVRLDDVAPAGELAPNRAKPAGGATPGPWLDCGEGTLRDPLTGRSIATRVIEAQGFGRILEVYDYSNEPDANFRLMLAAPELLAALEEAMREVEGFEQRTGIKQFVAWVSHTRAAIAKAKGE